MAICIKAYLFESNGHAPLLVAGYSADEARYFGIKHRNLPFNADVEATREEGADLIAKRLAKPGVLYEAVN